mmetsp:Transcript_31058/g.72864  ORF Transcript_31058/g.72864 Transcript_31058/m.72864 type:complete len:230 (+) Transcript_31058:635-1324(+)
MECHKSGDCLTNGARRPLLSHLCRKVPGHIKAGTEVRMVQLRQHDHWLVSGRSLQALLLPKLQELMPPRRNFARPCKAAVQLHVQAQDRHRIAEQVVVSCFIHIASHDDHTSIGTRARVAGVVGIVGLEKLVCTGGAKAVPSQPQIFGVVCPIPALLRRGGERPLHCRVQRGAEPCRSTADDAEVLEDGRHHQPQAQTFLCGSVLNCLGGLLVVVIWYIPPWNNHHHLL